MVPGKATKVVLFAFKLVLHQALEVLVETSRS
jgi:hypothetical protein